jgi:hypothetical protein
MSQLGQKAKYSLRANVVRYCPNNRQAAIATPSPFGADIVAKVFLGWRTKILRAADASYARRREGPHRFTQNRSRISVVALKSDAAVEKSKEQLSRDFQGCSIFDFCNNICHKPTSLERNETNTLSVEAHPRDGESVEAKGMPKVK